MSFFPSYDLTKEVFVPTPWKMRSIYKPGSVFLLEQKENLNQVYINSKSLIPVNGYLLGGVGLEKWDTYKLYGQFSPEKPSWYQWTQPNQVKSFFHVVKVAHKDKKRANKLRLPASVWKKVGRKKDPQKKKDRNVMRKVLSQRDGSPVTSCFDKPIVSRVNSLFGSPRTLPSGRTYYHSGLDLKARTGTPVKTTAAGEVVFAGHMVVPGNTVVVHHGGGLFSRYMHLSKIQVKKGQSIKSGELVGKAGGTGRVEGPHLHWEIIWRGFHLNPTQFVKKWAKVCKTMALN